TFRVRRICGSCPESLGLAQWQVGFPQRRGTAQIEPGRRSPRVVKRCRISKRRASNSGSEMGMGGGLLGCVYTNTQNNATKKGNRASYNFCVAHPYNNVAFGLRLNGYKGDRHAKVERALKAAALWDEVKDKLHKSGLSLSGGQQQRLC